MQRRAVSFICALRIGVRRVGFLVSEGGRHRCDSWICVVDLYRL